MQVQNSIISLVSSREHQKSFQHTKTLNTWNNTPPVASKNESKTVRNIDKNATDLSKDSLSLDPKLQTLKLILEALTGKKINITDLDEFKTEPQSANMNISSQPLKPENTPEMTGWGIDYQETTTISETEQNSIMASGIVKTTDGKDINFSINLTMKREFKSSSTFSFKAGDALIDPLVINLNGNAADLTDTKFKFDINSDGAEENLAWLKGASGFLIFDRNNDGVVNNGKELFGPETGNGFSELSELDHDDNGFIDGNDPDFKNLLLWSGTTFEESQLAPLEKYGIGAIGLINVKTEFSVKDEVNNTLGKIQQTGIYLKENGQAGTIQQIDLSV